MSALWGLAVNGAIPTGAGPVVSWRNGLPFNAAGRLVVGVGLTPDHWSNGIPFNAAGEVMTNGAAGAGWSAGLPFDASGRLYCNVGPAANWICGVPIHAAGHVVTA